MKKQKRVAARQHISSVSVARPKNEGSATATCPESNGGTVCPKNDGSCLKGLTGILTNEEIRRLKLIPDEEFIESSLKGTSYDLRLGEGHYVYKGDRWELVWIGDASDMSEDFKQGVNQTLDIEPFGSALIQLKETVDTKRCIDEKKTFVIGRFDLKLKMFIRGIISQQATQVEPNCIGKLFCYIFNQTGEPISLKYKDKIATIEFSYVSCTTRCSCQRYNELKKMFNLEHQTKYIQDNGKPKSYCGEHGIKDIRFFKTNSELYLPKEGGITVLYNEIQSLKKGVDNFEVNILKWSSEKKIQKRLIVII